MNFPKYKLTYIFLSILGLTSCSKTAERTESPDTTHAEVENVVEMTPAQIRTAGVVVGNVTPRQISGTIRVSGKLDVPPQQLISVSAPLGGFLKSTPLLQGSRVKKGQRIATIENLDFIQIQQDYLEAKSQFDLARSDFDRQKQLAKENVNSQKTLQQSQSNYKTWQAKYMALREKLKVLNLDPVAVENGTMRSSIDLYSPINGYVTDVNINIGKFANPTDVLFEIVDTEHLHAELVVFERDVPRLKIGQKVRFTLANESEERLATVYLIGREIGADRTVQIHCHIDKEDTELLPGMYLSAVVETDGATSPALPDEAVIDYQGRKYIFVESPQSDATPGEAGIRYFQMSEISSGNSELGFVAVSVPDSLEKAGIVVKGAYSLLSKLKNSEEGGGHGH